MRQGENGVSFDVNSATQPAAAAPRSERQLAVHGAFWTIAGYGGAQVLRLVSNLVLARLLVPSDFGTMALVNVLLLGLQMI